MTSAATILSELKSLGSEGYRKMLRDHGAREPLFGVKISELKKIQKRIKKNHDLALALYKSGKYDAMYLAGLTSIKADADLDLDELKGLLHRVHTTIHASPNRVRGAMNSFVIHLGSHVKVLTADAMKAARKIGTVTIDMGNTACKVPDAFEYINKAKTRGTIGTKRKTVKC